MSWAWIFGSFILIVVCSTVSLLISLKRRRDS
jgi:hypothetical protein